ncbi:hypothetical protein J6590_047618 [Homalodisca vitripennis]|nr:hypothetical protein J6590_047618 [Homalodisca vitripennis]
MQKSVSKKCSESESRRSSDNARNVQPSALMLAALSRDICSVIIQAQLSIKIKFHFSGRTLKTELRSKSPGALEEDFASSWNKRVVSSCRYCYFGQVGRGRDFPRYEKDKINRKKIALAVATSRIAILLEGGRTRMRFEVVNGAARRRETDGERSNRWYQWGD